MAKFLTVNQVLCNIDRDALWHTRQGHPDVIAPALKRALYRSPGSTYEVNNNWDRVGMFWRCPGCGRNRLQCFCLGKSGTWRCALFEHHDHFADWAAEQVAEALGVSQYGMPMPFKMLVDWCCTFRPTIVCHHCNVADVAAKKIIGAPPEFTFSPGQIAQFVTSSPNEKHGYLPRKVREVWDFANCQLEVRRIFFGAHLDKMLNGESWHCVLRPKSNPDLWGFTEPYGANDPVSHTQFDARASV